MFNVTDGVTSLQLLTPRGQFYGINSSDGAVAIGNHVYLPNFSGVARYEVVNGKFLYAQDSYKPAEVPYDGGQTGLTEHIDRGLQLPLPLGGVQDQIFTTPAIGAEHVFRVDSASRNPFNAEWIGLDGPIIVNPAIAAAGGTWTYVCGGENCPNPGVYGNDNVYVDISDFAPGFTNRYLINDMTRDGATTGSPDTYQIVLNVFWWDQSEPLFGKWKHKASIASPPIPTNGANVGSTSITIAKHPTTGKLAAFVAHNIGVMVFDMEGLKAIGGQLGPLAFRQNVETTSQVSGLAAVEDHVFFIENGLAADSEQMKGYVWTTSSTIPLDVTPANIWTKPLVNALPESTLPRNPGQARRARVRNLPGSTGGFPNRHVYFAQDPYLIQWKWPRNDNGTPKPNELDLTGYWRSDYDSFMQDCRIHDFPALSTAQGMTYVLVARETEAFALVGPIE